MTDVGADVTIRGHVQGVGYRHFCYLRARNHALTGWVKNDRDGSVALHVEGEKNAIETLISELKVGPYAAAVGQIDVNWSERSGRYSSFDVVG